MIKGYTHLPQGRSHMIFLCSGQRSIDVTPFSLSTYKIRVVKLSKYLKYFGCYHCIAIGNIQDPVFMSISIHK